MTLLKQCAFEFFPPELALIDWRGIWDRPLEDGAAFQWSVVAAVTRKMADHGWDCKFPLIELGLDPALMTLRNEVPVAHLAQAGHSATSDQSFALEERFRQSLIPKLTFKKESRTLSLFIEGCPYHMIATGQRYEIRPDILVLPGELKSISKQGQMIAYEYVYSDELILRGTLRVSSSRLLPLVRREPAQDIPLAVSCAIECSVNKSARIASRQIEAYKAVFQFSEDEGTFLVTGNEISADCGPMAQVNLKTEDLSGLKSSLLSAAEKIRLHLVESDAV